MKCVVAQVPLISGHENARRLVRADLIEPTQGMFAADREARYRGEAPMTIPAVAPEGEPCAMPTADTLRVVHVDARVARAVVASTRCTLRSVEMFWEYEPGAYLPWISPTPLLMVVAAGDHLTVSRPGDRRVRARAASRSGSRSSQRRPLRRLHRRLRGAPAGRRVTGSSRTCSRGSRSPSRPVRAAAVRRARRRGAPAAGRAGPAGPIRWKNARMRVPGPRLVTSTRSARSPISGRPSPTPGLSRRGRMPSPSSSTATATPWSSMLADDVHAARLVLIAIRVQDRVRHGFTDNHSNGVPVDGDPPQRVQHRTSRSRRAAGLGRQVYVEQGGLHNLAHGKGYARPRRFYTNCQVMSRTGS